MSALAADIDHADTSVSAVITFAVPPGQEHSFRAWQRRTQEVEARFKGFLRHKVEPPIAGLRDDWMVILTFDSDANLSSWLESSERQALLRDGERFNAGLNVKRVSYGFNFWLPEDSAAQPTKSFVLKSNLLVLLVLYPIVYLWGTFVSQPFIDAHGVPFWLSLFIGNLVSTQLLGWWVVPATFKAFDWWLASKTTWQRQFGGYALVTVLYAAAMAGYAWLLSRT